jgi:DNA-dependent protein kinase catalytic subunit
MEYEESDLDKEKISCFLIYKKHIKEVFVRMKQFKDELLAACLQFLLSLPKQFIETNLIDSFHCLEVRI